MGWYMSVKSVAYFMLEKWKRNIFRVQFYVNIEK